MNYEMIIRDLTSWNTDEAFFRDYYEAKRRGESVEALLADERVSKEDRGYAAHPETIDPNKTEEDFFHAARNISIVKHPRYFPYFTHRHSFFEILYVLTGHCEEITQDRSVLLKEGELCLIAPDVEHGIKVFDESVVLNVLIRSSTFMDIFLNTVRDKSQIALFFLGSLYEKNKIRYLLYHASGDELIRNYILDMYMEQILPDEYSDRIMCSLLTIFFTQLSRRHGRTVEACDSPGVVPEYSDAMLGYIIENYDSVTLTDLAEHFHFSVPYCSKIIKEFSGTSFSELVTRVRMQQGENLLSHTQMSIADIGIRVGYKNPETFIRAFRRTYGQSPSQYRKMVGEGRSDTRP